MLPTLPMPMMLAAGEVGGWNVLFIVLLLLGSALVLGTVAELFKQSAIVGYLAAGMLVGPNVFGLVGDESMGDVDLIAELGVALLLFTIGLEFSFDRLRRLGTVALLGGTLQIVITAAVVWGAASVVGLGPKAALAVGCMVALSSTATVLRLLVDTATIEAPHGRNATGILLVQDVAVLPVTLTVSALALGGSMGEMAFSLGKTLLFAAVLVGAFLLLFNFVVPKLLNLRQWARNREFPILLAVVLAFGSAGAAHYIEVSPAIGAFLAGVLMASSPFATQVRADIASLRTALVTLFFAAVGMLADPGWAIANMHLVAGATLAVLVGKAAVVLGVLSLPTKLLHQAPIPAALTGMCIAQVGEFSFVLAKIARGSLIDEQAFKLIVSVTVVTLFATPYLVKFGPKIALTIRRRQSDEHASIELEQPVADEERKVILAGFGPAGQLVAGDLINHYGDRLTVLDLNPKARATAEQYGLSFQSGDATNAEVLEHAGLQSAAAFIVTLPDPAIVRQVVHVARQLCPHVTIIARSRYHAARWEIMLAGAEVVVDEEEQVGRRLAVEARRTLGVQRSDAEDEPAEA
ncbi:MAG: cation:proton antiporter [Planctomycetota bacterium]